MKTSASIPYSQILIPQTQTIAINNLVFFIQNVNIGPVGS